ncbi:DUF4286 family protein [Flammeovirgaceae bacterium SG7u.111]|nr:DUF4286 family protein [Flammeovirgaceae bacterium SG7u.132]WPO35449.1 DUF4286 family protein [Flammeovirgaceae bacterium SG7u.111]
MIVYNFTVNIEKPSKEEWLGWMQQYFIPKVMQTGVFVDYKLMRLINEEENNTGTTFALQLRCENLTRLNVFLQDHAERLIQWHYTKFKERHVSFNTILEEL